MATHPPGFFASAHSKGLKIEKCASADSKELTYSRALLIRMSLSNRMVGKELLGKRGDAGDSAMRFVISLYLRHALV